MTSNYLFHFGGIYIVIWSQIFDVVASSGNANGILKLVWKTNIFVPPQIFLEAKNMFGAWGKKPMDYDNQLAEPLASPPPQSKIHCFF